MRAKQLRTVAFTILIKIGKGILFLVLYPLPHFLNSGTTFNFSNHHQLLTVSAKLQQSTTGYTTIRNMNYKKNIVVPADQQCEMRTYDSKVGRGPSSRFCNNGNKKVIVALILLLSGVIVGSCVYFFFVANKGDACAQIILNGTAGEKLIGNGICNGGVYMTDACSYDGGDCVAFNLNYPDCPIEELAESVHVTKSVIIGDGVCDSGVYMTEECGYEGNDCNECVNDIPAGTEALIGNGVCNGGVYMSEAACNLDGGDCSECAKIIPSGTEALVGDGFCNGGLYFTEECGQDGGDCSECAKIIPSGTEALVGDGFCNGGHFMTDACSNDGGDCAPIGSCSAIPSNLVNTNTIVAADVNNDGLVDLIIGNAFEEANQLLLNTGDATGDGTTSFQMPINLPGGEMSTETIVAADVNNDGFVDLIIGTFYGQTNQLLLNTGDATGDGTTLFQTPINLPGGEMSALAIVAADVNNDGLVDLIIGNAFEEANQLLLNTGDATGNGTTLFQMPINLPGSEMSTWDIVVTDVNNDGFIDLIIGNYKQVNQLLLNTGDATGNGTTLFQTQNNLPGGEMSTLAIVAADVNNDGFIDLIIGNYGQANQLLLNTGDAFQSAINLPGGSTHTTTAIVAADMNNDGLVDLIIGNFGAGAMVNQTTNQVLLNNAGSGGDGTTIFGSAIVDIPCSNGTQTWSLAVADMDNDGHLDIVFGNQYQKKQLLMNLGDGISYKEPAGLGSSWLPDGNEVE
jgi:hypothetical protein